VLVYRPVLGFGPCTMARPSTSAVFSHKANEFTEVATKYHSLGGCYAVPLLVREKIPEQSWTPIRMVDAARPWRVWHIHRAFALFLACFRFHFTSSLSMVALGVAITVRNKRSKFWNWFGPSHFAAMSGGIVMGSSAFMSLRLYRSTMRPSSRLLFDVPVAVDIQKLYPAHVVPRCPQFPDFGNRNGFIRLQPVRIPMVTSFRYYSVIHRDTFFHAVTKKFLRSFLGKLEYHFFMR
jgi:hypothetical protein